MPTPRGAAVHSLVEAVAVVVVVVAAVAAVVDFAAEIQCAPMHLDWGCQKNLG
jgi:hypothetical protein